MRAARVRAGWLTQLVEAACAALNNAGDRHLEHVAQLPSLTSRSASVAWRKALQSASKAERRSRGRRHSSPNCTHAASLTPAGRFVRTEMLDRPGNGRENDA